MGGFVFVFPNSREAIAMRVLVHRWRPGGPANARPNFRPRASVKQLILSVLVDHGMSDTAGIPRQAG